MLSDEFKDSQQKSSPSLDTSTDGKKGREMRDKKDEENATTLPITEKLRKSVLKRQKYLSVLDQLNLLRFLSSLE